ncbi:hypothetical protein QUC31_002486 [Theobroma cacao]
MENVARNHEADIENNASQEKLLKDFAEGIQSKYNIVMHNSQRPLIQDRIICCVNPELREANAAAYRPKFVVIGPLRCYGSILEHIEMQKRIYLASFLQRAEKKASLNDFYKLIKDSADEIHGCYEETYCRSWDFLSHKIRQDIVANLLRTLQLPYSFQKDCGKEKALCCKLPRIKWIKTKVMYFLDLISSSLLPSSRKPEQSLEAGQVKGKYLYSAVRLREAGVKFKVSTHRCLLDIEFNQNNGELKIPPLRLDELTESFFLNLLAWEQRYYPHETLIRDYIFLMEYLIKSTEDVDLLVRKRILIDQLGSHNAVMIGVNSARYEQRNINWRRKEKLNRYIDVKGKKKADIFSSSGGTSFQRREGSSLKKQSAEREKEDTDSRRETGGEKYDVAKMGEVDKECDVAEKEWLREDTQVKKGRKECKYYLNLNDNLESSMGHKSRKGSKKEKQQRKRRQDC